MKPLLQNWQGGEIYGPVYKLWYENDGMMVY